MDRRQFLGSAAAMAQSSQMPLPPADEKVSSGAGEVSYNVTATIERKRPGRPHRGKMLAAIQPHCDDIPIFAAGTVLKLVDEGYEGILITMSDDAMAGDGVAARAERIDLPQLSKPQSRRLADCRNARPAGFSFPVFQSGYRPCVRSERTLRAEP